MIFDLLTKDTVEVNVDVDNWEDAVRAVGRLLVNAGVAEECYIQGMIDVVEEFGPYIVLLDGIAVAHARPDMGSKKIGLALITLRKPVVFGNPDHDPVSVVFGLCALDHSSHIDLIQEMATLFEKEDKFREAVTCETKEEVIKKIKEILI